jgi:uncharacterized membrane protein YbhN (UPF0104 family)
LPTDQADEQADRAGDEQADPAGDARAARSSRWARPAAVVAVAVVLASFAVTLAAQWDTIAAASWRLEPARFAAASVVLVASFALVAALWGVALAAAAGVPVRRGARIWFLANLARYVPGNVWSVLGAVELARREGAPRRAAAAVVALTQVLSVSVAVVVGLPVLVAQWARLGRPALVGLVVLAVAAACLALLWAARRPLLGLVRRRHPDLTLRELVPSPRVAAGLAAGYALYWLVAGLAFGLFAASVYEPAGAELPLLVAAYGAAYAVGFLSLLTPGGLGVREGVLVLVLAPVMPAGVAAVVAVLARVWMMLVELAGSVVAQVVAGRGGPPAAGHPGRPGTPGAAAGSR